jgi:hypothetical protein
MAPELSDVDPVLRQLRVISRVLLITNREAIERDLGRIANTDDRKRTWALLDGIRTTSEIAGLLKMSERGVQLFIAKAAGAGFIETAPRKPPTRAIDLVPESWADLAAQLVVTTSPTSSGTPSEVSPSQTISPQSVPGEAKPDA